MKNTVLLLICLFIVSFTLTAQITERNVGPFNALTVSGKLEVTLVPGEEERISIDETGRPEGQVSIEIKGTELKLNLLEGWVQQGRPVQITVTYRSLLSIEAVFGANVKVQGTITQKNLQLVARSGAELTATLDTEFLEAQAAEGGVLKLSGTTLRQDAMARKGGRYDAASLDAGDTIVKSNTGGTATVVAFELLNASAATGGSIRYSGNPKEKLIDSKLAGDIQGI